MTAQGSSNTDLKPNDGDVRYPDANHLPKPVNKAVTPDCLIARACDAP